MTILEFYISRIKNNIYLFISILKKSQELIS